MKNIFIIIPYDAPSGPSKGAAALANLLVRFYPVSIICLRKGIGFNTYLNEKIKFIYLSKLNYFSKIKKIKNIYLQSGGKSKNISFSMCLQPDLVNIFLNKYSITISSIRANLFKNYTYDFNIFGLGMALVHLFSTRFHEITIAMNYSMALQIEKFSFKKAKIIKNFIDEENLKKYNNRPLAFDGIYRFCFVGNLVKRKGLETLIDAATKLLNYKFEILIIGGGPLHKELKEKVKKLELQNQIKFVGPLSDPYKIISKSHVMVLPSFSEGTSRAVLECLYLGIPCVIRNVDSNRELINHKNKNGRLFKFENELSELMIKVAKESVSRSYYGNLLPKEYSQSYCGQKYLKLIKEVK